MVGFRDGMLGECAGHPAEHWLADLEVGDTWPELVDHSAGFAAGDLVPWAPEPLDEPHDGR